MSGRGRTFLLSKDNGVTTSVLTGGTANTVAKFTGAYTIGDSSITDDGTTVTINPATSTLIRVNGSTIMDVRAGPGAAGGALIHGRYSATYGGIWSNGVTPSTSNYALIASLNSTVLNADTGGQVILNTNNQVGAGNGGVRFSNAFFGPHTENGVISLGDGTHSWKQFYADYTDTSGGVTGNRTINKMTGSVNFAAGASTIVVTNSVVTTSSKVFAQISTSGSTGVIGSVVPAAGSFAIVMATNPAAETRVQWFVLSTN